MISSRQHEGGTNESINTVGDNSRQQLRNNDLLMQIVDREEIEDEKIRSEIPEGSRIEVTLGENFDLSSLKIEEDIPSTKNFRVYKYKNPRTQRYVKILKCDHE